MKCKIPKRNLLGVLEYYEKDFTAPYIIDRAFELYGRETTAVVYDNFVIKNLRMRYLNQVLKDLDSNKEELIMKTWYFDFGFYDNATSESCIKGYLTPYQLFEALTSPSIIDSPLYNLLTPLDLESLKQDCPIQGWKKGQIKEFIERCVFSLPVPITITQNRISTRFYYTNLIKECINL